MKGIFSLLVVLFVLSHNVVNAQKTWDGGAGTNNWSDAANWNPDGLPTATDNVTIISGANVTVDIPDAVCALLSFASNGVNSSVTVTATNKLTASAVTYSDPSAAFVSQTLIIDGELALSGALTMGNIGNNERQELQINTTGTVRIGGNFVSSIAAENFLQLNGNAVLEVAGNMGNPLTASFSATSLVRFNGAAQTIYGQSFGQVEIKGSGAKTLTTTPAIMQSLTIDAGTSFNPAGLSLTVLGTTLVNGLLRDDNSTGTNTFAALTIASGADLTTAYASPFIFNGPLTNDGTISQTAAGAITLSGDPYTNNGTASWAGAVTVASGMALTGTTQVSFLNTVTLGAGVTLTNNNTGGVVVVGNLTGTDAASKFINNQTLTYAGAAAPMLVGELEASAVGNTVHYNQNGNQTIKATTYHTLNLSGTTGTRIKTLQGDTRVNGNLTISGTADISFGTPAKRLEVYGDLNATGRTMTMTGAAHVLRLGGAVNALGALATDANGQLVEYFRAGDQQVFGSTAYRHLQLTGSGSKMLQGNVTVNNDLSIAASCALYYGATARTVTVLGTLDAATGTIDMSSNDAHILNLSGAINALGTLTTDATNSTVNYNANGNQQVVASANYRNLTLSTSGIKTLQGDVVAGNQLLVSACTLDFGAVARTVTINGNLQEAGTSNLDLSGAAHVLNLYGAANTVDNIQGGILGSTVNYLRPGDQTVSGSGTGAYNLLRFGGSGTKTTGTAFTATDVTIDAGAILLNTANINYTISGTLLNNGTLTKIGTGILSLTGSTFTNNGPCTLGGTLTLNPASGTIEFGGSQKILITAAATVAADKKMVNSNTTGVDVTGSLLGANVGSVLENQSTLWYSSAAQTLMNTGTLDADWPGNTVIYNRNNTQTIKTATYHHLNTSGGAGVKTLQGNITINGNLTVENGTEFNLGTVANLVQVGQTTQVDGTLNFSNTSAKTLSLNGDLSGAGTLILSGLATHVLNLSGVNNSIGTLTTVAGNKISYQGTTDQQVMAKVYACQLEIAGTGNKTLQGAATATDVLINGGGLQLNGQTLTTTGNLSIAAAAELNVNANARLLVANTKGITNNGVFRLTGTAGNPAILDRNGATGAYTFVQNAGTMYAQYYQVNNISNGLVLNGGTIDNTDNLSNGSFSSGTGAQYLQLTGFDLSGFVNLVSNVQFNAGPTYNISRTAGSGSLILGDASGTLSGENFDNDNGNPGTLVNWTTPGTTYYSKGTLSAGLASSWSKTADGTGPSPDPSTLTDGTLTLIVQAGHTITVDNNGNIDARQLLVNGVFRIGQDGTARTVTIQELLQVNAGGTFQSASAGAHVLRIKGNLINYGNIDLQTTLTNTVATEFNGANLIDGTVSPIFYSVSLANSQLVSTLPLTINGNFSLTTASTFTDNGLTHKVGGDWIQNTGNTYAATGSIEFTGALSTIAGTAATISFNHVIFKGGGTVLTSAPVSFAGNVLVTSATRLKPGNYTVSFGGDLQVDAGSNYEQIANTSSFNGANAQLITLNGLSTFTTVTFSNGGANAKTITGNLIAGGLVTVNAGATVAGNGSHTFNAGFTLNGACDFSGSVLVAGGNLSSANASVSMGTASLSIQGNVQLTTTTGLQWNVGNQVSILSGSFILNNATMLVGQAGNSLTLSNGASLYVRGADNFPSGFGSYILQPASRVYYDGIMDQQVRGNLTYGEIQLGGGSYRKTVDGPLDVDGIAYFRSQVNLDLLNFAHTFAGNIDNNSNASIDGYNANVTLDALDAAQNVTTSGTGRYRFNNLTILLTSPTNTRIKSFASGAVLEIDGNLTLTNTGGNKDNQLIVDLANNTIGGSPENLSVGAWCQINTTHPDFYTAVTNPFSTKTFDVNSTVYYSSAGAQTIADGFAYGNITFNSGSKTARGALDINGNITRTIGTPVFYDGGYTHTVAGNWELNNAAYYTAASATGTIRFDGADQSINGVNFNNLIIANTGVANVANNLTAYGNITVQNGATIDLSTRNLTLAGNFTVDAIGTFTQTTGTTTFNGSANQTLTSSASSYLGNLIINKTVATNALQLMSALTVIGNTSVESDAGVFDIRNQSVTLSGGLTVKANASTPNFLSAGSTVTFNGADQQNIVNRYSGALTFNHLVFTGSGDKYLCAGTNNPVGLAQMQITGNVNIATGAKLSANANPGYTASVDLYVKGNWLNEGTFSHNNARSVYFDGANQTISSSAFSNVVIAGTGTKTLTGDITLSQDLTLTAAILDGNSKNITLGRNWVNNASYLSGTGKLTFNGANASITTGTTTGPQAGKSFYDVTINCSGTVSLAGDADIRNDLTIATGTLALGGYDCWLGGNFDNQSTFTQSATNSSFTLNATGGTKSFNPNGATLRGFIVNAPGATYQLQSNFTLASSDPQFTAGTFVLNGKKITLSDTNRKIEINGGTLWVDAGGQIDFVNNNQRINLSAGEFRLLGTALSSAQLYRNGNTNIFVVDQTGGTLFVQYYKVTNGRFVLSGGTLDATSNFSYGTFADGQNGTAYITVSTPVIPNYTIQRVVFNNGANTNVSRNSGTGSLTFVDASGGLAGEGYDVDNGNPGTLVNWSFPSGYYWDGGDLIDNQDWHRPDNWSGNTVPGITDMVYLNHDYVAGAYTARIKNANASVQRVSIDRQASANAITLVLQNGYDLTLGDHLQIGTGTTLTVTDNTNLINVGGNYTNNGTFNHGNSTLTFTGVNNPFIIESGGIGAGKAFYNVVFNAPDAIYSLSNAARFDGGVSILKGTLDLAGAANDITVAGNWYIDQTNGGLFNSSTADVTLNGAAQTVTNGTFYNLITAGTGTKQLGSNIAVNNTLTIGPATTLDGVENTLYVRGNWTNNGTFSQSGLGSVVFDGGNQTIDNGSVATAFNQLTFDNNGTKTFNRPSTIAGNLTINSGLTVNATTHTLTGVGADNTLTCFGTLELQGANNFPQGFEHLNFASNSTVRYNADIDQTVFATTYGNLILTRPGNSNPNSVKLADGDLTITGTLTLGGKVTMDAATRQSYVKLTGNLVMPNTSLINWGTGNATLEHVGGDFQIDADLVRVNHLILSGTTGSNKWLQGNLIADGNVRVKANIDFFMYPDNNRNQFSTLTGAAGKTFTVESAARVFNTRPSNNGVAAPTGFSNYNYDPNSAYYLYSLAGTNQTISSTPVAGYGNLIFESAKTVTSDGVKELVIQGNLEMRAATYADAGKDIRVAGANVYITNYTPSAGVTLTLDGNRNQTVQNDQANGAVINLMNLICKGTGVKTLGGNDNYVLAGNVTINNPVTLTTARNVTHTGALWTNNSFFRQTGGTLTFSGTTDKTIKAGATNANNYFGVVVFDGPSVKTFVTNGADFRGSVTINAGTVNLGALSHKMSGNLTNTLGGVLQSANADIEFGGGNQSINSPAFEVMNVTLSGTGSKTMLTNLTVHQHLLIASGSTLVTSNNSINIKGNWTNNGTFTVGTSKVTFNGANANVNITSGGSNFYEVDFAPTAATTYQLVSPLTRISRTALIGTQANLQVGSSKTLVLGSNTALAKIFTVNGTLDVQADGFLKFNNQNSKSVLTVNSGGRLRLVGSDMSHLATLTRETAGVAGAETQVDIESGGILEARYYLIEYLHDAGMNLKPGSQLDAINNLSDGTWSNLRAANPARYLTLESNYSGGSINNITFNFVGTPVQGQQFNVRRETAVPDITFTQVLGNLGTYQFEKDEVAVSAIAGKLRWPTVNLSNWTGAVNTDWHNPGNWDNGVPTLAVDAIIPDRANDPVISAGDAACQKLTLTDGRLQLSNNRILTTSGDVTIGSAASTAVLQINSPASELIVGGNWDCGTNGIFGHGNATVTFNSGNGFTTIKPGTSEFNHVVINNVATIFNLTGTSAVIRGNLEVRNGILNPGTNNYTWSIGGNASVASGAVFNPVGGSVTSGLIRLNGANQQIQNLSFSNLEVSGTGTKTVNGTTPINGTTTVKTGATLLAAADGVFDFNGNVTIETGAGFNDGNQSHTFSGADWTGNGLYTGSGTVVFDATAINQNINSGSFHNLIIDCTGRNLSILGAINLTGDFTVKQGTGQVDLATWQLTHTAGTGNLNMENGTRMFVRGANNFPKGFALYNLDANSTVYYQGTGNQNIDGIAYGHLTLANQTKTLMGDVVVQGNLNFGDATLDVAPNSYALSVAGTWNNNTGGHFICRTGEVSFIGSGNQQINYGATTTNSFYDLRVDKSAGSVIANQNTTNNFTINQHLFVESGQFDANGRTIYIGGDMTAWGSGGFANSGTYYLQKVSGTANLSVNGSTLNNLTINSSGSAVYTLGDNLSLSGDLRITKGTLNGNGRYVSAGNGYSDVIVIAGIYQVGAGGTLGIGEGTTLTVEAAGTIEVIGSSAAIARVTRNAASNGRYDFTVNGTIKARNYLFEYMSGTGIYVTGTIDPVYNFSYGTFTSGAGNSPLLRIENTQTLTGANRINQVSFPVDPGGTASNVAKYTATSGTVEFYDATGPFAGENFDNDPLNLIIWTGPVTLTWNGSVSSDWNTAANWTASAGPSIVPTGAENVIIATAVNQPRLTTFGAKTANLTINDGASLTLTTPADGGQNDLAVMGDITIKGTLNAVSQNDYLSVTGNWLKTATGNVMLTSSTVTFNGTGVARTINNANVPFYNLNIEGSSLYQLGANTTINNNLYIASGASFTVSPTNYTLTVKGNWTNQGTFNAQAGKVFLSATTGPRTIEGGNSAFYDLELVPTSSVTYRLNQPLGVNRLLMLTSGTLDVNAQTLRVGDGAGTTDKITIGGTLVVGAGSVMQLGNSSTLDVSMGGTLRLLGTSAASRAMITAYNNGRYAFVVNDGGTLSASYYQVENTNADGLWMLSGAILDPVYNLSDGLFTKGAGGTYLKLANDMASDQQVANVQFNAGATNNVTRTSGTTIFEFTDALGALAGYEFESDIDAPDAASGLIHWSMPNSYVWTGNVDTNWHEPGNWSGGMVPDADKNALIPATATRFPLISMAPASAKTVTVNAGANLSLSNDLSVIEDFYYDGQVEAIGSPLITVGENWISAVGTFLPGNSTVHLTSWSGIKNITPAAGSFYNLHISSGATYLSSALLRVANDLTISSGNLNANGFDIQVGGSLQNAGNLIMGSQTLLFNGTTAGNRLINTGASSLYRMEVNSSTGLAVYKLAAPCSISNNLILSRGIFDLSPDGGATSYNLTVGNRLTNTGATFYARNGIIQVGENLDFRGTSVFNCGTSSINMITPLVSIRSIATRGQALYRLSVSGNTSFRMADNLLVGNQLNIVSGTLDMGTATTYNLTLSGNWDNQGSFLPQTGTVTFNGSSQVVTSTSAWNFYNLSNQSQIAFNRPVTVQNMLVLNGSVDMQGNTLQLGVNTLQPGSLTYTSGSVAGKMERWLTTIETDYRFPVGSITQAQTATIRFITSLTSGKLAVEYLDSDPGNNGFPLSDAGVIVTAPFTDGYWRTTASNGLASSDYNIALTATGFSSKPLYTNTRVVKSDDGGSFTLQGSHVVGLLTEMKRAGLNGLSSGTTDFALGSVECSGGTIDGDQIICKDDDAAACANVLSPAGGTGYNYIWQHTTDSNLDPGDAGWVDIGSSNALSYDPSNQTQTIFFVRKASSTGCPVTYSNKVEIIVNERPNPGGVYKVEP